MTLFVPSAYALTTLSEAGGCDGTEWHVFVDVTAEDREETIYFHFVPRFRGPHIRWSVTRMTACTVDRTNIERLCHEFAWPDVPIRVRHAVLQDLGITA